MLVRLRSRMAAAALVPLVVVVVAIVAVFLSVRLDDLDSAHRQRGRLLLRQLAMASEYGVFSGNQASLQAVVQSLAQEPDVRSVAVFDAKGAVLAWAGSWTPANYRDLASAAQASQWRSQDVDTLTGRIEAQSVVPDDFFSNAGGEGAAQPVAPLGYAALEMSHARLQSRAHSLLMWAIALGLSGIVLAWLIAESLGRRVMQPVMRISQRIGQIGQGDFVPQWPSGTADPLASLHLGLNTMAQLLRQARDALEQRVEVVTQELRQKKEEAESATMAKSRFLAAASHDLRQPTHALGMLVARLGQLPMDETMREVVRSVALSVQATQDLLDALLDVSRFDAGAVQVEVQPVNLTALLVQVRVGLAATAQAKGLRLRVRTGTGALWIMSDAVLLQRILMNLAHNAVRYTERGTVLIACRPVGAGRQLRIDVLDSGIGISPAHQTRIFEEFYQVGNAQRDRTYGLGLGLSIVDRGARLLGHAIGLRSALGCGTRFSITVPLATSPAPAPVPVHWPQEPARAEGGEPGNVMVIEDDMLALDAMRILLVSWGYQVCAMPDLAQARQELLQGFKPHALVADYRIGSSENGIGAIASLRMLAGQALPACLISGDADATLIAAASAAGLTLLHKPVRPEPLRHFLRRVVADAKDSA